MLMGTRGKRVSADVTIPRPLVLEKLHIEPELLADYWRYSAVGAAMSGTIGIHGHYANGLAALAIATGQDVACVAESATGITRVEDLLVLEVCAGANTTRRNGIWQIFYTESESNLRP